MEMYSDCFDTFSDKLVGDIKKVQQKVTNIASFSMPRGIEKSQLEELHRDLQSLIYGVQYEIGELRREISINNNIECSDELFKARNIIRLQSLTSKISEYIDKAVEN